MYKDVFFHPNIFHLLKKVIKTSKDIAATVGDNNFSEEPMQSLVINHCNC